jgi:hypothetical protein
VKASILERLMSVDRHRPKMVDVGVFTAPVVMRFASGPEEGPWVTSLSTGRFTLTRPNKDGDVGQAFVLRPPDQEDDLLKELYRTLWTLSLEHRWGNRCSSIGEAVQRMLAFGLQPKTLTVPFEMLREIVGSELTEEEADKLTLARGFVTEVSGVQVISARQALEKNTAILSTLRPLVGHYTRVREHVGVTVLQADRSLILVGGDAVA